MPMNRVTIPTRKVRMTKGAAKTVLLHLAVQQPSKEIKTATPPIIRVPIANVEGSMLKFIYPVLSIKDSLSIVSTPKAILAPPRRKIKTESIRTILPQQILALFE